MTPDRTVIDSTHQPVDQEFDILLKPISHPELGEIRIDENLFAIGRTEAPFDSYPPELVADLSRRHARIFSEYGAVYIADLDSKNGTTVNGVNIRQKISKLQDGDEIGFGRTLSYRVQLRTHTEAPRRATKLVSLTLAPDRNDLGLQPIVITRFPFLISKADEAFSRYKEEYPHQVTYISRRHAHIFLKGGAPFVEDLGSTNGTFVDGKRLDEHAVPLEDDSVLAFGGHHFVYRVNLQKEEAGAEPTVTRFGGPAQKNAAQGAAPGAMQGAAQAAEAGDKTTFVAAADSFLDIFCVDKAQQQEDEARRDESKQADEAGAQPARRRKRGKFVIMLSQLHQAFSGGERKSSRHALWWAVSFVAVLGVGAFMLYLRGEPERELNDLLARGDYATAATVADEYLKRDPDNAQFKALSTEAMLKDNVPKWLALLKAREFDRAAAVLAGMKQLASHNSDAQSLVGELEWIGQIEKFVLGRGGMDAPIRIYADEETIRALLQRWDEDTKGHQRSLARISSYVPEFREPYAEALSHLRRLQSDDSLAAINRLKATIVAELNRDRPEALESVLNEYAEKYPRLAGLDTLRKDLQQYIAIDREARARKLGPLIGLLSRSRISTPPFQAKLNELAASNRLPSSDVVQQYDVVSRAWRQGDAKQAFAGLQKMSSGPWSDVAAKQLAHKKAVSEQFAELQKGRGARGYEDRLISFYGSLDHDEDTYFIKATEADVNVYRGKALRQAQQLSNRAQALWRQYRENGAIDGGQRLESGISQKFRTQARLLSEAQEDAQQGLQIYIQLKAEYPPEWTKVRDEINTEAELQRRSLQELSRVLEPDLLKAKLALLGGSER